MTNETPTLECPSCGVSTLEATVSGGSYVLRCERCKRGIVATSWIAVGPAIKHIICVYKDGEPGSAVLVGIGSVIWEKVSRLTADGTVLVIRNDAERAGGL